MKNLIFLLTFLSTVLVSCNTDIEIAGEWENIPVIYSILDHNDAVHYVRINRVFLGNQSAYDMALQADSLIYNDTLDVKVHVYNDLNAYVRTLTFQKVPMLKDSVNEHGQVVFAVNKHHVYQSTQTLPSGRDYTYKLVVTLPDGKEITSICHPLVGFSQTNPGNGQKYSLLPNRNFGPRFRLPKYSGGVKVNIYFHYYEFYNPDNYVRKTIMMPIKLTRLSAGSELSLSVKANDVINRFKTELTPPPANMKRFIGKVDFEYVIADEDYAEQLWNRNSSVNTEAMPITNIKGGFGIFASRNYLINKGYQPTDETREAFFTNSELRLLGFQKTLIYFQDGIHLLP
jgi:hypothetical protein